MSATVWSAAKEPPTGGKRESCYLIAVSVRMTLAGCGGVCRWTVARIAAVCVCAAVGPRGAFLHRSHNLQCPAHACTATLARQPEHRKTTAGITSPRCWIKSSLYPQKSRINTKNVNVCTEREGEREREGWHRVFFCRAQHYFTQNRIGACVCARVCALIVPHPVLCA